MVPLPCRAKRAACEKEVELKTGEKLCEEGEWK